MTGPFRLAVLYSCSDIYLRPGTRIRIRFHSRTKPPPSKDRTTVARSRKFKYRYYMISEEYKLLMEVSPCSKYLEGLRGAKSDLPVLGPDLFWVLPTRDGHDLRDGRRVCLRILGSIHVSRCTGGHAAYDMLNLCTRKK